MSVLGYASESKLKNLLVALADGERDIEASRQRLARYHDFTLLSAFERVDRNLHNTVNSHDIYNFLRDNAIYSVTEGEVFNLVKYFENDLNYSLSYKEFSQIFLPCEDSRLRNDILSRRPMVRIGRYERLRLDIESTLAEIILKEINLARNIEALKRALVQSYDFSSTAAFNTLDRWKRGYLDVFALDDFFRKIHHPLSDYVIMAIIRRIDTEGDAKIGFMEFAEFMRTDSAVQLARTLPLDVYPYKTSSLVYPITYVPQLVYTTPRPVEVVYSTPLRKSVVDDHVNLSTTYGDTLTRARSQSYVSPYTGHIYTRFI